MPACGRDMHAPFLGSTRRRPAARGFRFGRKPGTVLAEEDGGRTPNEVWNGGNTKLSVVLGEKGLAEKVVNLL